MKRGLALIEVLVVCVIVAILAAIVYPVIARAKEKGNEVNCVAQLSQLGKALNLYEVDNGGVIVPLTDDVMAALVGTGGNLVQCPGRSSLVSPIIKTTGYALNACIDGSPLVSAPSSTFLAVEAACVNIRISGPGPHESCVDRLAVPDKDAFPHILGQPINGPIGPWGVERHFGRANYLFVDSHVRSLSRAQLRLPGKGTNPCKYDALRFIGPEDGGRFAN